MRACRPQLVRSQSAFFKRRPPLLLIRGREHHQKFIVAGNGNLDVSDRDRSTEEEGEQERQRQELVCSPTPLRENVAS